MKNCINFQKKKVRRRIRHCKIFHRSNNPRRKNVGTRNYKTSINQFRLYMWLGHQLFNSVYRRVGFSEKNCVALCALDMHFIQSAICSILKLSSEHIEFKNKCRKNMHSWLVVTLQLIR